MISSLKTPSTRKLQSYHNKSPFKKKRNKQVRISCAYILGYVRKMKHNHNVQYQHVRQCQRVGNLRTPLCHLIQPTQTIPQLPLLTATSLTVKLSLHWRCSEHSYPIIVGVEKLSQVVSHKLTMKMD